jgi:hypothetical protein
MIFIQRKFIKTVSLCVFIAPLQSSKYDCSFRRQNLRSGMKQLLSCEIVIVGGSVKVA